MIYLDYNSTAPLRDEVRDAWLEALERARGNPSSLHASGREARQLVDAARERAAAALGAHEDEVVFTSGGTESNNLALFGVLGAAGGGAGLVTCVVEHSSVLEPARVLEARGHDVTWLAVDAEGRVSLEAAADAAGRPSVGLVSLQTANNETGALQPVAELGARLREAGAAGPLVHTDAVQAVGRVPWSFETSGADLASVSAHKVGGPVGVGVLLRRRGVKLAPQLVGGGQEGGLRAGTEDAAGIHAASVAWELAMSERRAFAEHARACVDVLWSELSRALPGIRVVGPPLGSDTRLPNTLNVWLPGVDGRVLVTRLDLDGVHTSAGSACASGSLEPSHVLRAMGFEEDDARAALRLSVGRSTTLEACVRAAAVVQKVLGALHAK